MTKTVPADADGAPYGTAKADMHDYPAINHVFDVNYADPELLKNLCGYIRNTRRNVPGGKTVVVTHGPEMRAFAKENYAKYKDIVDQAAELAEGGVEFRMCDGAMRAAGFEPEDMHGFITLVPAGFAEIIYWQAKGYRYINPNPLPVGGTRYVDHPEKKPRK